MSQEEINELVVKNIKEIEKLKKDIKEHNHDSRNSQKINIDNILFNKIGLNFIYKELLDDTEIIIPINNGVGFVTAGTTEKDIMSTATFAFSNDGDVYFMGKTSNVDNTDSDGSLCVYNAGTVGFPDVRIKNRLGSTKIVKYIIFS